MQTEPPTLDEELEEARVLVELGELREAELRVASLLDADAPDTEALDLFAKIKHMRGELSQVLACWAEIQSAVPRSETALAQLRAILHITMDHEHGAGEFLAIGRVELVRKALVHLELEEVFRTFLARKPDEARSRCEALAKRWHAEDPHAFKLTVLANAWISELSGEPEAAAKTLEALGSERGFETDIDRVLALLRLYERIGTVEKLEAAAHICRYVEAHASDAHPSIVGRLASILRRLGQPERAGDLEEVYLRRYRRRMHRSTLAETLRVAARAYLPIPLLARVRLHGPPPGDDASPRERALAAALACDWVGARAGLSAGGTILDEKYLADVAACVGDLGEAVSRRIRAHDAEPGDVRLLCAMLSDADPSSSPVVSNVFGDPERRAHAVQTLEAALHSDPQRPVLWRALAALVSLDPEHEARAAEHRQRAAAIEQASSRHASSIGRALAAAVYHVLGETRGIIHEVSAAREFIGYGRGGALRAERILGNLSVQMRQGVQSTFFSVREYVRAKLPELTGDILDYDYTYKVMKEDETSTGHSAGLPTALAFFSVFTGHPLAQDIASSGIIVADAHDVVHLRSVGDSEYKVQAATHRNLRMIVLPAANRPELRANALVPRAVEEEVVRYAADFDEAVRLVFGGELFPSSQRAQAFGDEVALGEAVAHTSD